MRMKFFLLLWLVVNVQGFRIAEDVFSDLFPFDVDHEDWLEDDAVRQKRDPLSIVLTVENDKCGKDDPTYLSLPAEGKLEAPKKGSELFVKACPCKSKSSASKKSPTSMRKPPKPPAQPPKQPPVVEGPPVMPPVIEKPPVHSYIPVDPPTPPEEPEEPPKVEPPKEPEPPKTVPENPFEYLKKDPEYSPELSGRFFAGDSMEYLSSSNKKITSMESEELLNGKYAEASSLWDREVKQSPMATYASMKWDTNPFAPPPQPPQSTSPHYFVDYAPSQHHKDLPYEVQCKQPTPDVMKLIEKLYSTPEHTWSRTDHNFGDKELEIIHRINSKYDFSHSQTEYERQERTREAVLDYIKSKYYLKNPAKQPKKRIFVVHSNF